MVRAVYPDISAHRMIVRKLGDRLYNELQWITSVQEEVGRVAMDHVLAQQAPPLIALVESAHNAAAGRLAFPEWERVQIPHAPLPPAATLRTCLFSGSTDLSSLRQLQGAGPGSRSRARSCRARTSLLAGDSIFWAASAPLGGRAHPPGSS
jgi:hypothetical protein